MSRSFKNLQRLVGANILAIAVPAMFAEGAVRTPLLVGQTGQTMVDNIMSNPMLFQLAFAAFLLAFVLDVPVSVLFHQLLKRGQETLSLISMALRLVYTAIVIAVLLNFANGVMLVLNASASGLEPEMLFFLVESAFATYDSGFHLALFVFGFHLIGLGVLMMRNRVVPIWLSLWTLLGGIAYLLDNLSRFIAPDISALLTPAVVVLALGELVLGLWLLILPRAESKTRRIDTVAAVLA